MPLATISNVARIELPRHTAATGELVVIERGASIPFDAVRTFTVRADQGALRGRHAHKRCSQFMVCVHGAVLVECDDANAKSSFALDRSGIGLLVPPGIWASQTYTTDGAVLLVLCDRPYEADDYLRDYDGFVAWRRTQ